MDRMDLGRCFDGQMGWAKRRMEEIAARGFGETGDQAICLACIPNEDLREETRKHLTERECTFCHATADDDLEVPIAAPFDEFMTTIMNAVHFLFSTPEHALAWDHEDGQWIGGEVIDTTDMIYQLCEDDVTAEVLDAIIDAISEPLEWTSDNISQLRPDEALRYGWEAFCDKVKYSSRFVFLSTKEEHSDHPDEFTTGELLERVDQALRENSAVVTVPAGRTFWRGRMTDDPADAAKWNVASELGSPPRTIASNNRMSPSGISMFYGADDVATAVAEISAHDSQSHAVVGEFETLRPLTLLDLAHLTLVPSVYTDAGRTPAYYDLLFLRAFAADLGKSIELDGREHIEYVPTQVITEYLRYVPDSPVDGILYRSSQNGGVCCVVFCDSAGCVDPGFPARALWEIAPSLLLRTVHAVPVPAGLTMP